MSHNKDLIEHAVSVSQLEHALQPLSDSLKRVREHVVTVAQQLTDPYKLMEVPSIIAQRKKRERNGSKRGKKKRKTWKRMGAMRG